MIFPLAKKSGSTATFLLWKGRGEKKRSSDKLSEKTVWKGGSLRSTMAWKGVYLPFPLLSKKKKRREMGIFGP